VVYTRIQVAFDAADPEKLAESRGIDPSEFGDQASRIDPAGQGPRLYFQRVPEGKTAKNRVHLDVRVAGPELRGPERDKLVAETVARLQAAGGTIAWLTDGKRGKATVMRDPEGNEFCVT
jgi:hypothetical protein